MFGGFFCINYYMQSKFNLSTAVYLEFRALQTTDKCFKNRLCSSSDYL